jgi:mRNA interferase YafQ
MRCITQRTQFRVDLRRQKRRGKDIEGVIAAVELLAQEGTLGAEYRPHRLRGEWKGVWECHIESDWLLIYQITRNEVLLIRTGRNLTCLNHSRANHLMRDSGLR